MKICENYIREEINGDQCNMKTSHVLSDVTVHWIAVLPIPLKFGFVIDCNS